MMPTVGEIVAFGLPVVFAVVVAAVIVMAVGFSIEGVMTLEKPEVRFLLAVVVAGLALRVAAAVVTYHLLPYGYFAPDEVGYIEVGTKLARYPLNPDLNQVLASQAWPYFNAVLIQLFGVNELVPRLWNCMVGAVIPVLGYLLARRLGAQSGARWTATLLAAFPSLVLWSSLNLKDADVWCLILAGLLLILRLQESVGWKSLLSLLVILTALFAVRQYPVLALLAGLAVSQIAPHLVASRPLRFVVGAAALVAGGVVIVPGVAQSLYARLGNLAAIRHNLAKGARSAVDADPGLQTLGGAIAFLPLGLVDFLLRPFPWELTGTQRILVPELIVYYGLLVMTVVGVAHSLKVHPLRTVPLVSYFVVIMVGYGLVLGNLGLSYRERDQVLILMLVFVGVAADVVGRHLHPKSAEVETKVDQVAAGG